MAEQRLSLAPGPSPTSEHDSPPREITKQFSSSGSGSSSWKKRVSTACLACKKSKRKCSGSAPCENCRAFQRVCIFDESLDQRRRVAAKRTADELSYHRDLLNDLFQLVRDADEPKALHLLGLIRQNTPASDIRAYITDTLTDLAVAGNSASTSSVSGSSLATSEAISKIEDARNLINVEGTTPTFRRKVMDIHFLCDDAPVKVPAHPWTRVTQDADLVAHLVSLYFTWNYPFHAFLDQGVFLRHMARGELSSEFCSPFLVNALLSNACYFSEFSESYVVEGDISSKGTDFLAEAERLKDELPVQPSLASLQGTLLMYERYAMLRNDDLGYVTLHEAIRMGESLGLVGSKGPRLTSEQLSLDMDISCRRTAWGLFNLDTMVHTGFLRPCLINYVNIPRIDLTLPEDQSLWRPYPTHREACLSYSSLFFDEACNLSTIARDISQSMFADQRGASGAFDTETDRRQSRDNLYEQLRRWDELLPEAIENGGQFSPHVILLKMRHNTLIINLFSCISRNRVPSTTSEAPKTPESPPSQTLDSKFNAWETAQAAARQIAMLTRLHRRDYGLGRAHPFAMYAINLALFTMLEQKSFDVLDSDFLSLASAFSIVASRSALGRNLFHIFRQSVRAKAQGDRLRDSTMITDDVKGLFDESPSTKGHSRFDEYAEGLEKLNRDRKYHGIGSEWGQNLQDYPGLGLSEMLDRYESLSLGKDDVLTERYRPFEC
ncbi:hypothetical protein N7462_000151 [Penicillium macrosclerotiorum]|uniref:uncharacterized protein n=1 Tax=Penicillium macrosclerotiorum TaxID=303699 RepID=UPI002547757E|nr:uncharacterized protein N7462_000151 [Penicillium macrosclerotiorum]KAJ5698146.1 hypothetical protein N7462_000151 [Penicillium macrosclerotiorum]